MEAGPRDHALVADVAELRPQKAEEIHLELVARCEVRVPSLRCDHLVSSAAPDHERLAERGERGFGAPDVAGEDHAPALRSAAAARSRSQRRRPDVGAMSCTGSRSGSAGPSRTALRVSALSAPVTRSWRSRPWFNMGAVRVIRAAPSRAAWLRTTQRLRSFSAGLAGKSEAV